jgi:N-acetylneuraminic acid mutarotase
MNGKVLVTGGKDTYFSQNSTELYDPTTETWTTVDSMNFKRLCHSASLLTNGKVLVAGGDFNGTTSNSAELYSSFEIN